MDPQFFCALSWLFNDKYSLPSEGVHLHSISFVLGLVVLKSAHPLEKLFSKIGKQTRKSNTSNTILQRHLFFVNIPRASFAAEFFFTKGHGTRHTRCSFEVKLAKGNP